MTAKLLRNTLKEAEKKGQLGLLIWANWSLWDNWGFQIQPGNQIYEYALSQISKGEETTFSAEWIGLSMSGFIAVSVEKLNSSDEFFKHVLKACKKGNYQGPITLVPLNEISESY